MEDKKDVIFKINIALIIKRFTILLFSLIISFVIVLELERTKTIFCLPIEEHYGPYDPCKIWAYTADFHTYFGNTVKTDRYLAELQMRGYRYTQCDCEVPMHQSAIYAQATFEDFIVVILIGLLLNLVYYSTVYLFKKYRFRVRITK